MNVNRYDPNYAAITQADDLCVVVDDGMFVLASDYDRDVEALRTELSELKNSMAYRTSLVGRLESERDALAAENARLREALDALLEECDPLKLNTGEPWCRARAELGDTIWECSKCGACTSDEYVHVDHIEECDAALQPSPGQKEVD